MSASKHFKRVVLSAAIAAVSLSTFAATQDGTKGNSSTAKVDVNAQVAQKVQITGATAINLDTELANWTGGDVSGTDLLCVWSSTEAYNVTITDASTAAGFNLESTGQNDLPFSVSWADETTAADTIVHGDALTAQVTTANNKTCTNVGGTNATLTVTLAEADLEAARAAVYTGELTVVVAPE
ncbi:hypothetical protein FHR99_000885 [Litorivivens lipolytica]|uniref:Uncharacterized protein n=1 Tax=Litorivivens lipolytica TaxID=1524264 RepID=A0A7W4W4C9_9GAMM|nr:hypothetical protein [Litorivivens lipolytica]MBB3046649.1 hypothetical protein [Litorivivens lipolytica]